jgi:hypothetical protein
MTWLQALVALALFAPGAVAPSACLNILSLSMFFMAVFAVGFVTSFWTGGLINRIGSLRIASLCAGAMVASMALASFGSGPALLLAGLCLGLAFGPETPASTALLGGARYNAGNGVAREWLEKSAALGNPHAKQIRARCAARD